MMELIKEKNAKRLMSKRNKKKVTNLMTGNAANAFIGRRSTDVLYEEDREREQQNININCNT